MILIAGLGNPGKEYEKNRHNVGFLIVDKLRESWNFPDFELNKKLDSEIIKKEFMIHNSKFMILLAKPQTFMNASGEAVRRIIDFYKLNSENIIVIHDDLDIEIGNYKIQKDVRSVGHNGVESIINHLGTQNFTRVRVGVEKQGGRKERNVPGEDFVLQDFIPEELEIILALSGSIAFDIKKLLA